MASVAMGQQATPTPTSSQQLIDDAANQRAVGQPSSMSPTQSDGTPVATVAPAVLGEAIAQGVREIEAQRAADTAFEAETHNLRPGQFVWRPERAASGPFEMVVSLQAQRIYVYRANRLVGVSTVSTGRAGHSTPTGTFPILEKNRIHHSNLYNNAPMPNMQRLTWDGIALHAGVIPGVPASHGCVRLPMEFSRLLFGVTARGERVHIVRDRPESALDAIALVRQPRNGTQIASAAR